MTAKTRVQQILIVFAGLVAAAIMGVLGIWQLNVFNQQGSDAAAARAAEPAVALAEVATPGQQVLDGFGRTVSFSGSYDASTQLLVPIPEEPGKLRVLTALIQSDGSAVPVVRGIVDDHETSPPPTGVQQQRGILLPSEDDLEQEAGPGEIGSVRLSVLAQQWEQPLVAGYVTLSADDAEAQGLERAQATLPKGEGRARNGAYALQWWVFAAFGIGMAIKMARDLGVKVDYAEATAEPEPDDSPTTT